MKKLLIGLLSVFLFIGSAIAENETLEFEIDPVATANAPWKVGERTWDGIVMDSPDAGYITFLGITTDAQVIIQQFYASGNKYTDPFAVPSVENASDPMFPHQRIDSLYTQWYENGQMRFRGALQKGHKHGLWTNWYENGQKSSEGHFENNKEVGVWHHWDRSGNLTREINY